MASQTKTKYVLITGCSDNGIGSALAKSFHAKGLHIIATARNITKMQNLQSLPNITFLELDVTSPESITAAYTIVEKQTNGKLDYLVNNSGAGFVMPLLDSDIDMGKNMFEVNVWGVIRVTQVFAPLVVNAKGMIVNNVSTAACLGLPYQGMFEPNPSIQYVKPRKGHYIILNRIQIRNVLRLQSRNSPNKRNTSPRNETPGSESDHRHHGEHPYKMV
jgi:short-subunit dehydrogenase